MMDASQMDHLPAPEERVEPYKPRRGEPHLPSPHTSADYEYRAKDRRALDRTKKAFAVNYDGGLAVRTEGSSKHHPTPDAIRVAYIHNITNGHDSRAV